MPTPPVFSLQLDPQANMHLVSDLCTMFGQFIYPHSPFTACTAGDVVTWFHNLSSLPCSSEACNFNILGRQIKRYQLCNLYKYLGSLSRSWWFFPYLDNAQKSCTGWLVSFWRNGLSVCDLLPREAALCGSSVHCEGLAHGRWLGKKGCLGKPSEWEDSGRGEKEHACVEIPLWKKLRDRAMLCWWN